MTFTVTVPLPGTTPVDHTDASFHVPDVVVLVCAVSAVVKAERSNPRTSLKNFIIAVRWRAGLSPHETTKFFAIFLLFSTVIRGFPRNGHIMRMAFRNAGSCYLHKFSLLKLFYVFRAAISHAGFESTGKLIKDF